MNDYKKMDRERLYVHTIRTMNMDDSLFRIPSALTIRQYSYLYKRYECMRMAILLRREGFDTKILRNNQKFLSQCYIQEEDDRYVMRWNGLRVSSFAMCSYDDSLLLDIRDFEFSYLIHSVYTHPFFRKRGAATRLLRTIISRYPSRMFVLEAENKKLISFYMKLGFHSLPDYLMYMVRRPC